MLNSRRHTILWIATVSLAVVLPFVKGQDAPQAGRGPGGGGGGRGNVPAGDYNKTTRSAADKALPNTYLRDETFLKFPYKGRALGSTSAIAIDKDGKSVWIAERCGGQDVCNDSTVAMIIKFDPDGKVVKMFGAGEIYYPHGLYVDRDGNLWVADLQSNVDRPSRGGGPKPTAPAGTVPNGNQIVKYSPEGRILLKLGVPGVYGTDEKHFGQPSFAITAANGDIFVADGHDTPETNQRIVKFDKTGKFLRPGERAARARVSSIARMRWPSTLRDVCS